MVDYGQGSQRALDTQQEIRVPAIVPAIFITLQVFDSWGLSEEEIWIAEYHLAPVSLSNEC